MIYRNEVISLDIRERIASRYKTITKAINTSFWGTNSDVEHSLYVGSYGRGTAIDASDVDIIVELPFTEKNRIDNCKNNGQSYLLQLVKNAIVNSYPQSDIHADGQVVVINFSDGLKFEIVPVFKSYNPYNRTSKYIYPDTNDGGRWQSTNPKAEQEAMNEANDYFHSNGLLKDTCKTIRRIKNEYFSSYHLSGILIDSFVCEAIGNWHWLRYGESNGNSLISCEQSLLNFYNNHSYGSICTTVIFAPGSGMEVGTDDWEILGKVLRKMASL